MVVVVGCRGEKFLSSTEEEFPIPEDFFFCLCIFNLYHPHYFKHHKRLGTVLILPTKRTYQPVHQKVVVSVKLNAKISGLAFFFSFKVGGGRGHLEEKYYKFKNEQLSDPHTSSHLCLGSTGK